MDTIKTLTEQIAYRWNYSLDRADLAEITFIYFQPGENFTPCSITYKDGLKVSVFDQSGYASIEFSDKNWMTRKQVVERLTRTLASVKCMEEAINEEDRLNSIESRMKLIKSELCELEKLGAK